MLSPSQSWESVVSRRDSLRMDYDVGYGKPPPGHRFTKGQSGNPAGSRPKAPKGSKPSTLKGELLDELGHKMPVTENGRRRRLSKRTIFVKKLMADALNGDAKARDQMLRLASQAEPHAETSETQDLIGAAKDAEVLARFRDEVIRQHKERRK
jgi:hypothetical protein